MPYSQRSRLILRFPRWDLGRNICSCHLVLIPSSQGVVQQGRSLYPRHATHKVGLPDSLRSRLLTFSRSLRGHVADLTAGTWNPTNATEFLTSSNDSTLRIWDTSNRMAHKSIIVVKSKERGARTKVTMCAYSSDGKLVGGGCEDGTVHYWDTRTNLARPVRSCETAHAKGVGAVSGIAFTKDGSQMVTRGGDDTVKRECHIFPVERH